MTTVKQYLHCDKADVAYECENQGLTDDQISNVIGAIYEVEFLIDADTGTILAVQGKAQDKAEKYEG